jgi:hypothetical protein
MATGLTAAPYGVLALDGSRFYLLEELAGLVRPCPCRGRRKRVCLTRLSPSSHLALLEFGDNPHRMDNAGDKAEDRKYDVDPEVLGQSYLQEYPQRGKDDREHNP